MSKLELLTLCQYIKSGTYTTAIADEQYSTILFADRSIRNYINWCSIKGISFLWTIEEKNKRTPLVYFLRYDPQVVLFKIVCTSLDMTPWPCDMQPVSIIVFFPFFPSVQMKFVKRQKNYKMKSETLTWTLKNIMVTLFCKIMPLMCSLFGSPWKDCSLSKWNQWNLSWRYNLFFLGWLDLPGVP